MQYARSVSIDNKVIERIEFVDDFEQYSTELLIVASRMCTILHDNKMWWHNNGSELYTEGESGV